MSLRTTHLVEAAHPCHQRLRRGFSVLAEVLGLVDTCALVAKLNAGFGSLSHTGAFELPALRAVGAACAGECPERGRPRGRLRVAGHRHLERAFFVGLETEKDAAAWLDVLLGGYLELRCRSGSRHSVGRQATELHEHARHARIVGHGGRGPSGTRRRSRALGQTRSSYVRRPGPGRGRGGPDHLRAAHGCIACRRCRRDRQRERSCGTCEQR